MRLYHHVGKYIQYISTTYLNTTVCSIGTNLYHRGSAAALSYISHSMHFAYLLLFLQVLYMNVHVVTVFSVTRTLGDSRSQTM